MGNIMIRVYVILKSISCEKADILDLLKKLRGIAEEHELMGSPDMMVVIEAPNRQSALDYLTDLIDKLEGKSEVENVYPVSKTIKMNASTFCKDQSFVKT